MTRSKAWFASELNVLNARPDDTPPTPLNLEPMSAISAVGYTPYLTMLPSSPLEELNLPLSKEMSLSVISDRGGGGY